MTGKSGHAKPGPRHWQKVAAGAALILAGTIQSGFALEFCAAPPPVVRNMTAETFYIDRPKSIVDRGTVRHNVRMLSPLDHGLTAIIAGADVALEKESTIAGRCSARWLASWASGAAMLGRMNRPQAEFERKWRTAGIAIAYLKLQAFATAQEQQAIETWLKKLALRVQNEALGRDNHRNWAGLAQTAVGVATNDETLIGLGRLLFDLALTEIAADGTLPLEMRRASRALHYHNYALAPLVMMAELAALRGENWYERGGGALHRLVNVTMAGLTQPELFSARVGVPVEVPRDGILAWTTFYEKRFPGRIQGIRIEHDDNYYWLGGQAGVTAKLWLARQSG